MTQGNTKKNVHGAGERAYYISNTEMYWLPYLKRLEDWVLMAHTYNPSYSRRRDQED
jgi:hypothetical protein